MIEVSITGDCKNLEKAIIDFVLMVEKEKGTKNSANEK